MTILILGGGALGAEAVRLAKAAGCRVLLGDRAAGCPARPLADEFFLLDAATDPLPPAEFLLPALENQAVLERLTGENVLFDLSAWNKTASRLAADRLLQALELPAPACFPQGSEPYLVKPDRGSFGRGIWVTEDFCEVGGAVNAGFVAQEELAGPVWSQVILGKPGDYKICPPARLTFDALRRRVDASLDSAPGAEALAAGAEKLAAALSLRGVLEVEAIFHQGLWKITDLNARLPMLTGAALLAEGINLVGELIARR